MLQDQGYRVSLSALDQYMCEVKRTEPLTSEEERQLCLQLAEGIHAQQARDRLVEGCQQMIIGLAKRFVRGCQHMELLDFVQEGNHGLLEAMKRYDGRRTESSFKTFAFTWVRVTMLLAYWQHERAIRVPLHKVRSIRRMKSCKIQLLATLGREPTITEIGKEMGMMGRDVLELRTLQEQQVMSVHMPLDDGETLLEEVLEDPAATAFADDGFSSAEDVLDLLPERERAVIQLRYGLVDGCVYTQQEVAHLLGIGLSTVKVLDRRAKMRLRRSLAA
jgi:RNA polymerase sigma factor (sigma-70 family)